MQFSVDKLKFFFFQGNRQCWCKVFVHFNNYTTTAAAQKSQYYSTEQDLLWLIIIIDTCCWYPRRMLKNVKYSVAYKAGTPGTFFCGDDDLQWRSLPFILLFFISLLQRMKINCSLLTIFSLSKNECHKRLPEAITCRIFCTQFAVKNYLLSVFFKYLREYSRSLRICHLKEFLLNTTEKDIHDYKIHIKLNKYRGSNFLPSFHYIFNVQWF